MAEAGGDHKRGASCSLRAAPSEHVAVQPDTVAADFLLDPLTYIRVRRATAERLDDRASAERWAAREAALLARLQTDEAAALYRLLR